MLFPGTARTPRLGYGGAGGRCFVDNGNGQAGFEPGIKFGVTVGQFGENRYQSGLIHISACNEYHKGSQRVIICLWIFFNT